MGDWLKTTKPTLVARCWCQVSSCIIKAVQCRPRLISRDASTSNVNATNITGVLSCAYSKDML